jgi:hypothetical protein
MTACLHLHYLTDWQVTFGILACFAAGWAGCFFCHKDDILH